MTIAALRRHDRRLDELRARPAWMLTDDEIDEASRIERARDCLWRRLPTRIAQLRHTLAQLETYADEIGVCPR